MVFLIELTDGGKGNGLEDELGDAQSSHKAAGKWSYQTKSSIEACMLTDCKNINADHISQRKLKSVGNRQEIQRFQ